MSSGGNRVSDGMPFEELIQVDVMDKLVDRKLISLNDAEQRKRKKVAGSHVGLAGTQPDGSANATMHRNSIV